MTLTFLFMCCIISDKSQQDDIYGSRSPKAKSLTNYLAIEDVTICCYVQSRGLGCAVVALEATESNLLLNGHDSTPTLLSYARHRDIFRLDNTGSHSGLPVLGALGIISRLSTMSRQDIGICYD